MKLPFVSRELYEASQQQVAELKEERRLLLNRLAEALGARPVFEEQGTREQGMREQGTENREQTLLAPEGAAAAPQVPERTKATIDGVEAWANQYAMKRAQERGMLAAR
jgi:hypothetical protein